jgi:AcrR family transcriptional regulator
MNDAALRSESWRRAVIVEAAYRCVADKGLYGLRMRDVAAAARVNIATVHYYLTSKTDLIRAVVEDAHDRFRQHAAPPEGSNPARRLRVHLDRVFKLLNDDPRLGRVLAEVALHAERDPVVAEIVAAAEDRWREMVQAMMAPVPRRQARPVALLVVLAIKGACLPAVTKTDLRAAHRELARYVEQRLTEPTGERRSPVPDKVGREAHSSRPKRMYG